MNSSVEITGNVNDFHGLQPAMRDEMRTQSWEIQERATRFEAAVARLCEQVPATVSAQKTVRKLTAATKAMRIGYKDTCCSSAPEQFIDRISAVARDAKRARTCLVLLVELNHLSIEAAREPVLEARGLEAIFVASRNTAKRRARKRMVSRRNPSERAAQTSDGKTRRKRQNPPGVT
jgi:hypothetical protein